MLPRDKDVARVTRWAALAFKSRAALYEGTWRKYRGLPDADKYLQQAADAAATFIAESGYSLYKEGTELTATSFAATTPSRAKSFWPVSTISRG